MKKFRHAWACLPFLLFFGIAAAQETIARPTLVASFNFDSEDSLAAWHQDVGKDETPNKVTLSAESPHAGRAALEFTVLKTSPRRCTVYTGLELTPSAGGHPLRLHFYCRSNNTESGQMQVSVLERNSTGVIGWAGGKATYTAKASGQWQENELKVPVDNGTQVIVLYFGLKNPVGSQSFMLDDVSVETY